MKNLFAIFFITLCLSFSAYAKTVYVTDKTKHMLRSEGHSKGKIISMLYAGTALDIINENLLTGFMHVRTKKGLEGYILSTNTLERPSRAWYLKKTKQELELLQQSHVTLSQELEQLKLKNNEAMVSNKSLTAGYEKLSKKFIDLRKASSNPVEIKLQRDKLQNRVISVERELQQVKHQNQVLEDNTDQDWFIYGGILVLFSVMLGFVLSKLNWQRKSSNWDEF